MRDRYETSNGSLQKSLSAPTQNLQYQVSPVQMMDQMMDHHPSPSQHFNQSYAPHGMGGSVLNYFSLFNVQGLQQKNRPSTVPFLKDILLDKKQVFIALTET